MLPATILPNMISARDQPFVIAPSLQHYLKSLDSKSPYEVLPHSFEVLSFVEALHAIDLKHARVIHTSDSSRQALTLLQKSADECANNATHIFSSLALYDTLQLLSKQAKGGSLIAIIQDIESLAETQLLYVLCGMYTTVRISKLAVSHTRAERVLLCAGFKCFVPVPCPPFTFELPIFFRTRLEEINSMNGQLRFDLRRCMQHAKCQEWLDMHLTPVKMQANDASNVC